MLKMALLDCVVNEKCCSVDRRWGIFPLFSSSLQKIWQLKSPHPQGFAIQGKKIANVRGSAQGGAGRRWELTDAQHLNVLFVDLNHCIKPWLCFSPCSLKSLHYAGYLCIRGPLTKILTGWEYEQNNAFYVKELELGPKEKVDLSQASSPIRFQNGG